MRAAIARPVPVLPEVGSMIVPPGRRRPSRSAASTSRIATRSLIEPPGLKYSSLATTWGLTPAPMRLSRTSGVSPTVSRIESLISALEPVADELIGLTIGNRGLPAGAVVGAAIFWLILIWISHGAVLICRARPLPEPDRG